MHIQYSNMHTSRPKKRICIQCMRTGISAYRMIKWYAYRSIAQHLYLWNLFEYPYCVFCLVFDICPSMFKKPMNQYFTSFLGDPHRYRYLLVLYPKNLQILIVLVLTGSYTYTHTCIHTCVYIHTCIHAYTYMH